MNLKGFEILSNPQNITELKKRMRSYKYKAVDNSNNDPHRIYISCSFKCVLIILTFVNELFTTKAL